MDSYGAHLSSYWERYHKMLPCNKHRNGFSEQIEKHCEKKRFHWWKAYFRHRTTTTAIATCLWVLFPHFVFVCVSLKFSFCVLLPNDEIMYSKCVHAIRSFTHNIHKYRNLFWIETNINGKCIEIGCCWSKRLNTHLKR